MIDGVIVDIHICGFRHLYNKNLPKFSQIYDKDYIDSKGSIETYKKSSRLSFICRYNIKMASVKFKMEIEVK